MKNWIDEPNRLTQEAREAIEKAGGNPKGFDLFEIGKFLYACQCNSIEIWKGIEDNILHVSYNPPVNMEN